MTDPVNVPTDLVLQQVIAQRDKALTDLAVAQAGIQHLSARIRELEGEQNHRPRAVTGTD